ncbi:MAG: protein phosphatase 2C domain-containing protein [Alphaproteobacteria bacterium]|nr:protein phosphatase 2C domain-containing protein [Alphaproteobacteria bacterium]
MSDDLKVTKIIGVAVKDLADIVTQENVPDPGDGYRGFFGLPPELRRILVILDRMATNNRRRRMEARAAELDEVSGGHPSQLPPYPPARPAAAPPVPVPDPLFGATKYVPTEEFNDPLPPVKVPVPAETPPRNAASGATADHDAVAPARKQPPSTTTPDRTAAASEHETRPSVSVPQPGGVPAVPPRLTVLGNAAAPIERIKKTVYMKNARANEAYEGAVEVDGLKGLKLDDDGGSGLFLDEAVGLLKGTPTASGDFVIRLQGLLHGKRCDVAANLAVIPDPRSLWLPKASDRTDRFWKRDEDFAQAEGDLLCVAASKRGRSHAKDGTFRDDDFGLLAIGPGDWHIAVVADGAGSAKYSRRGSKVAVDSVLRELPAMLEEHVTPELDKLVPAYLENIPGAEAGIKRELYQSLATSAFNAAKAIEEVAAAEGEKASAFSTTLIVVVVRKITEGWFIAGFGVGDGGAAVIDVRNGSLTTLTLPDSGEFAGQTRFLHKSEFSGGFDDVAKRIFFDVRNEFTAVVLMTDGISDPKFPTDSVFADPAKWVEFWNSDLTKDVDLSRDNKEMERQFLEWLDFWSLGNHDDRTLAVLVP